MKILLAKLAALSLLLLSTLSGQKPKSFGGVEAITQSQAETTTASIVATYQAAQLLANGKYAHVPRTSFDAPNPSTYEVNEMVYPDNTFGYQLIMSHYESQDTATGTIQVLKQTSIGYGKEANTLTYEK